MENDDKNHNDRESYDEIVDKKLRNGKQISAKEKKYMKILRYVLGGIMTWGGIAWIVGLVIQISWLWIVGIIIGAVLGGYLSYMHGLFRDDTTHEAKN